MYRYILYFAVFNAQLFYYRYIRAPCATCKKNHRHYAGGRGFNTNPTVQTHELTAALLHIPHRIDRHTQNKITTEPATIRALLSPNTILIPKQLNGVLNGAD